MLICELLKLHGVHILIPSILLVEKNFGKEPKHALVMNETLVIEEASEQLDRLINLAERMSVALQTRYSLMVCETKDQFDALIKTSDSFIEP